MKLNFEVHPTIGTLALFNFSPFKIKDTKIEQPLNLKGLKVGTGSKIGALWHPKTAQKLYHNNNTFVNGRRSH